MSEDKIYEAIRELAELNKDQILKNNDSLIDLAKIIDERFTVIEEQLKIVLINKQLNKEQLNVKPGT